MDKKNELRENVKSLLHEVSHQDWSKWSKDISHHLLQSSYWKHAQVIALTISRGKEVDTYYLIETAWKQGKKVVVPRTNFPKKTMNFYQITSFEQLEERPYQLKEPKTQYCQAVPNSMFDIVIVPGLAFDVEGRRLGFGGGFYDRFLPDLHVPTIALAFPCQMVSSVPTDPHDCEVEHVIGVDGFYV
ncbi:5-formyltetrahydrofolate cyclo-ligase [Halalkalibacter wakoensis JCM 9140]|uniref:5-formyltetrahydrofolate cyclo-ligase n=1 Tax=Halalkalibacter wakoensis JCM 9140 TaxID=1236970 RepID=W4PYJ8_9BACI|nr:5-formyltetrahydrofolate cyclo-ligase [Halalkalibacter wakoensis]GAE24765.1 5-formyltetrahydrofolate cyclo-ligase [Halalkalibacter wakoensis JCM 9140]